MTIHIPVNNTLTAAARAALLDHLNSTPLTRDLLDVEDGWTVDQSCAVAKELEDAGYGKERDGSFYFDYELRSPAQLPSDNLDELVPAVETINRIVQDVFTARTPENPNPANPLNVSWPILLQIQNVLLIATYAQQGMLTATDVNTQLPAVATLLARGIRTQVPD